MSLLVPSQWLFETDFNAESLLAGIVKWVELESPSNDRHAVMQMLALVEAAFVGMPVQTERIAGGAIRPDILKVTYGCALTPGILVLGHVDTVHPIGTAQSHLPIRRVGDRAFGPGILDMKSGVYLAVEALRKLLAAGLTPSLPITFLIIPDEEVGSPGSRSVIEQVARQHKYVLVPEPARKGKVVTGRHAFARYRVRVLGRPAHAGADNRFGASAINRMAKLIVDLESRSDGDRGITYSVGIVSGGTFVNVIPYSCEAQVLCVAPDEAALEEIEQTMQGLAVEGGGADGMGIEIERGPVRPLFKPSAGGLALFARASAIAQSLGVTLEHGQFGGGSDGNFTGALGIATLDGLGPVGSGPHTHDEHIFVSSLTSRCQILAEMMRTLE